MALPDFDKRYQELSSWADALWDLDKTLKKNVKSASSELSSAGSELKTLESDHGTKIQDTVTRALAILKEIAKLREGQRKAKEAEKKGDAKTAAALNKKLEKDYAVLEKKFTAMNKPLAEAQKINKAVAAVHAKAKEAVNAARP